MLGSIRLKIPESLRRFHRQRLPVRILQVFAGLFLLLVVFHRPLIFGALRVAAGWLERSQHLDIRYQASGSLVSSFLLSDLSVRSTEAGEIRNIAIGELRVSYSLPNFLRHGLADFVQELRVADATVELAPGSAAQADPNAHTQIPSFPVPRSLQLHNVSIRIRGEQSDFVLRDLNLSLRPEAPGSLSIALLELPGHPGWEKISARTGYSGRRLVLSDLRLGPDLLVPQAVVDLSESASGTIHAELHASAFGGSIDLTGSVMRSGSGAEISLALHAHHLELARMDPWMGSPRIKGRLESLSLRLNGDLEKWESFDGRVDLTGDDLEYTGYFFGRLEASLLAAGGNLRMNTEVRSGDALFRLNLGAKLPDLSAGLFAGKGYCSMELTLPDASGPGGALPVHGDGYAKVDLVLDGGSLEGVFSLATSSFSYAGSTIEGGMVSGTFWKEFAEGKPQPVLEGLATSVVAEAASIRGEAVAPFGFSGSVSSRETSLRLESVQLDQGSNTISLSGSCTLPPDLSIWDNADFQLSASLQLPELESLPVSGSPWSVSGPLQGEVSLGRHNGQLGGLLEMSGANIVFNGVPVEAMETQADLKNDRLDLRSFSIRCGPTNSASASGSFSFNGNQAYAGTLQLAFQDLAVLQPLVSTSKIGGRLTANWEGKGEWNTQSHAGWGSADLSEAILGQATGVTAHTRLSYDRDFIDIPDFTCGAEGLKASASAFWQGNRLRIYQLDLKDGTRTLLEGSASVPLHLFEGTSPDRLIPPSDDLELKLKTATLNIRELVSRFAPGSNVIDGRITAGADLHGSLAALSGQIDLKAERVRPAQGKPEAPAVDASMGLLLKPGRAILDGRIEQALTKPLTITGNIPFDAAGLVQKGKIDPDTPLQVALTMPSSSLAFLPSLVPAIRQARGSAKADLRVSGTIGRPNVEGGALINLDWLRFTDPALPPVNNLRVDLGCTGTRLTVREGKGTIAGGTIALAGNVDFGGEGAPVFALQLGSRNALVSQNDDMSIRVSSDISLTGPWDSAKLQGSVWITRSRFFRSIDILPIGLPGRPAPQPPPEPAPIGVFISPFKDWTVDITVKTLDPFLIQSNLAIGRLFVDLRVGGTGAQPWMDGIINVEQLVASLPFSRLNFESGQIAFTRQMPFIPQLNLTGTSTIRDYDVTVNLTGAATEPQAVFLSDPPLPQAEVISLLATGMTTAEFSRDPQALAGRATVLAFQKLTRRLFKRNGPPAPNDSFLNRIRFDVGGTDPKTGRQSTTLGIPLSERFLLTGGVDVGGNFRGQLRYLIRFQ